MNEDIDPRLAGPVPPELVHTSSAKRTMPDKRSWEVRESATVREARGMIRRRATEMQSVRYITNLKLSVSSVELFKVHAMLRRVAMSVLFSDIIDLWLSRATDTKMAVWAEMMPAGWTLPVVPERYPGYLASLGFAPAVDGVRVPHPTAVPPMKRRPPEPGTVPTPEPMTEPVPVLNRRPPDTRPAIQRVEVFPKREPEPEDDVPSAAPRYDMGMPKL